MLIILLICFLLFKSPVFAASDIQITDYSVKTPEWIQLSNSSGNSVDLTGWYFKDKDANIKTIDGCISSNSTKVFGFSGYLNDTGDNLSLYDKTNSIIHDLGSLTITQKDQPIGNSNCVIPTNTPTPTNTPNPTNTPTPTPTTDPTVINPSSGILLTEFMPYSSIEWIELYNSNDYDVKLVAWKIEDNNANTKNISELKIKSKNYAVFEFNLLLNNSDSDKLILYNQDQKIIDSYQYPSGKFDLEKSWSKNDNGWCQTNLSKNQSNYQCSTTITPTSTPIPTDEPTESTPTPTLSTTIPTDPIPTVDEEKNNSIQNTSDSSTKSGLVLGDSTNSTKRNFLPIILIFGGALLLLSPVIISKLKKS